MPQVVLVLALGLLVGCASDSGRSKPDVALSSGVGAQSEYRALRARFFDADASGRIALRGDVRQFLARFPDDERAAAVRVFGAWAELESGQRQAARSALVPVLHGPDGATRDFARVADAALLAREGQAKRALEALDRLEGRIVDLDERFVYGEERTRAAFAVGDRKLAMRALLAWLAQSPPDRLERARSTARTLLGLVRAQELALALSELRREPDREVAPELEAARVWLTGTIVARLTKLAIERADSELARRVLEVAPAALRGTPEGKKLVELSTSGPQAPAVVGRAVGLLLDLGDGTKRRRAASVAAGMTRALGSAESRSGAQDIELIVRSVTGRADEALAGLAGDGAAIFVAGLDDEGARAAAAYAEAARIPILLLRKAPAPVAAAGYTFELGLGDTEVERALGEALGARGRARVEKIGPGGAPCDADASSEGARFPLAEWRKASVSALFVSGDASCARDLAAQVHTSRLSVVLGLGLDASEAYATLGVATLVTQSGRYPTRAPPGGWYEALGHDAAALAGKALEALPREGLVRGGSVEVLHEKARDALAVAEAELWTSEARGFAKARTLPRKLGVLEGGPAPR